ncbi:MAG TPA: orotidine-5'-phosphate decarboxylase [Lacunisphaera sp.]|nr:orotidine-5'-phosphate decarboxylase [Lacunisphaera sp.]
MISSNPSAALKTAIQLTGSSLCVGLDPDPRFYPAALKNSGLSVQEQTCTFLQEVVRYAGSYACAFKAQKAFFDVLPGGQEILVNLIRFAKETAPGRPVFVDCKIGDIENTMEAYFGNLFGYLDADGIVVNPYMGADVLAPFLRTPERVGLVLVKTSNPGAAEMQEVRMHDGRPLWRHVLDLTHRYNTLGNLIPIVSCDVVSDPEGLEGRWPQGSLVLAAGYGAQAGVLRPSRSAISHAIFVNSSRSILYPVSANGESGDWRTAIAFAAEGTRNRLNFWRKQSLPLWEDTVSETASEKS